MEGKKTKLKRILIPIIAVILVVSLTAGFFIIKNNASSKTPENENTSSNVAMTSKRIEKEIFDYLTDEKYSVEYNGNYKYSTIYSVNFNPLLTDEQIVMVYKNIGKTSDRNGFLQYLYGRKDRDTVLEEVISIVDGQYVKSDQCGMKESGFFYGTVDRSYLFIDNGTGVTKTRNDGASYLYEITQTGYGLDGNIYYDTSNSKTKLYITEHFYSSTNPKVELLSVTYIYEMIETPNNSIPNSTIK